MYKDQPRDLFHGLCRRDFLLPAPGGLWCRLRVAPLWAAAPLHFQPAAHDLAVPRHITLNLIRLDPALRKGGIKARRLIAATPDLRRDRLPGSEPVWRDCPV